MAIAETAPQSDALDAALMQAHIPTLMLALVHLTGDMSHLTAQNRPVYAPLDEDNQGNIPEAVRAEMRARARDAMLSYQRSGKLPPPPDAGAVRAMMDFITGVDVPAHYVPFLREELGLEDVDAKHPHWDAPNLKEAAQRMSVLVIGAGMSGILAGVRLKQAGINFTIIEKNRDLGGTWLENSYPGCRVDTPNHMYSYSFEPNHDWPQHYSTQDVLLAYFKRVADKYGLREHIRFETAVEEAVYDEAAGRWAVRVRGRDGRAETLNVSAVISAVGQLNRPRLPDIKGRDSFKGPAFHSAQWRHDVDLKGKRVAVIGTGASAFQFIPIIAEQAASLTVFQRSAPWLAPTPDYHDDVAPGKQWLLEHVPGYEKWWRFFLFWTMTDGVYEAVKADKDWAGPEGTISLANHMLRELVAGRIRAQAPERPDIADAAVPAYPIGGKRMLRDNGVWIGALKRENVKLVTQAVSEITPEGLKTEDGALHEADVLIYGTGFYASRFLHPMTIVGRGGKSLHEQWAGDARAYLGMTAPGFPNFFMLYGPNTNIVVNGSIIFFSECSMRYIMGCLRLLAETGAHALEVRGDVHDAFNAKVDAANAQMAWGQKGVSSWYKNEFGRVSQNWPFPLVEYWSATLAPNADDFELS